MPAGLFGEHPGAFLVGSLLIAIYQAAKFAELDLGDPTTSRYVGRLYGAKARDFASARTYRTTLFAFVATSLILYYLICQISEPVLIGATKALTGQELKFDGIPFPLYIAALFMGLTQPVIPGLAKLGDAQRNFFHHRIDVPSRVIELSDSLTTAINARSGTNRRRLIKEIENFIEDAWLRRLEACGDLTFYKLQLEKAHLGDPTTAAKTLKESSAKELRELVERLVLFNLVAVMRKSGPSSLGEMEKWLEVESNLRPRELSGFISGLILSGLVFGLAVLTIWHILDELRPLVESHFGEGRLWPRSEYLGTELARIVPSIFVCLLISVCLLPNTNAWQPSTPDGTSTQITPNVLIEFGRSIASILIICFVVSLIIHVTAEFYQYGTAIDIRKNVSITKFAIIFVRTMPSLAISYCTLLYLSLHPHRMRIGFWRMLLVIAVTVSALALLVALTFLRFDFLLVVKDLGSGWDHALFYVLANALVSMAAFTSVALFFRAQNATPTAVATVRAALQTRRPRPRPQG